MFVARIFMLIKTKDLQANNLSFSLHVPPPPPLTNVLFNYFTLRRMFYYVIRLTYAYIYAYIFELPL